MQIQRIQNSFFIVLLAAVTLAFVLLVREFWQPLFWAAVLAIIFYPVLGRWERALRGRRTLAAVLTVLTILVIVILPLFFVGVAVSREAVGLYDRIATGEIDLQELLTRVERLAPLVTEPLGRVGVDFERLRAGLSNAAVATSGFVASQALNIGQNALRFTALFFLMLYVLFFFVRDGERIMDGVIRALPLGDQRERRLFAKFAEVARATLKGTLVVGLVQGFLGGLLFWILGIAAPVFWGMVMTVLSFLPAVGAALVWLPAAILLIATGEVVKGIILIAAGTLVVGLVDNILRPILVGRDTQMPDFLILVATLGGLTLFGISGFVIGPVIAALFLAVWEMFVQEYGGADDSEAVIEAAEHPHTIPDRPPEIVPPQPHSDPVVAPVAEEL